MIWVPIALHSWIDRRVRPLRLRRYPRRAQQQGNLPQGGEACGYCYAPTHVDCIHAYARVDPTIIAVRVYHCTARRAVVPRCHSRCNSRLIHVLSMCLLSTDPPSYEFASISSAWRACVRLFKWKNPNGETFLSKLTLAALEDIGYIVDPSKVSPARPPRGWAFKSQVAAYCRHY